MEIRFCLEKINGIKIKSFTFEQVRGGPTNHCTSDLSASFQSGPQVAVAAIEVERFKCKCLVIHSQGKWQQQPTIFDSCLCLQAS